MLGGGGTGLIVGGGGNADAPPDARAKFAELGGGGGGVGRAACIPVEGGGGGCMGAVSPRSVDFALAAAGGGVPAAGTGAACLATTGPSSALSKMWGGSRPRRVPVHVHARGAGGLGRASPRRWRREAGRPAAERPGRHTTGGGRRRAGVAAEGVRQPAEDRPFPEGAEVCASRCPRRGRKGVRGRRLHAGGRRHAEQRPFGGHPARGRGAEGRRGAGARGGRRRRTRSPPSLSQTLENIEVRAGLVVLRCHVAHLPHLPRVAAVHVTMHRAYGAFGGFRERAPHVLRDLLPGSQP